MWRLVRELFLSCRWHFLTVSSHAEEQREVMQTLPCLLYKGTNSTQEVHPRDLITIQSPHLLHSHIGDYRLKIRIMRENKHSVHSKWGKPPIIREKQSQIIIFKPSSFNL